MLCIWREDILNIYLLRLKGSRLLQLGVRDAAFGSFTPRASVSLSPVAPHVPQEP